MNERPVRRPWRYAAALLALCAAGGAMGEASSDAPVDLLAPAQATLVEVCRDVVESRPFDPAPCEDALVNRAAAPLERQRSHALLAAGYATGSDRVAAERHVARAAGAVSDWQVQGNIGLAQLYLGDYAEAAQTLSRAIELASGQAPALYLNHSLALRALGRFDQSAAAYQRFTESQRRSASMIPPTPAVR